MDAWCLHGTESFGQGYRRIILCDPSGVEDTWFFDLFHAL
jgi:hypothetical protein